MSHPGSRMIKNHTVVDRNMVTYYQYLTMHEPD